MTNSVMDEQLTHGQHQPIEEPSNVDTQEQVITEIIPAIEVDLAGKHLIEASAGTGKTWTLTGIVLRLLIEARRSPEHIIATTFTRAAAAEMRQRIHDRLVEFYQLLQWLNVLSSNPDNKEILYPKQLVIEPESHNESKKQSKDEDSQQAEDTFDAGLLNQDIEYEQKLSDEKRQQLRKKRKDWLVEQASYAHYDKLVGDPINLHLVQYLLDHVHTYQISEAIRRTALVLTTLDKLFVGTLDSLAQKWLTEYSSETGHQMGMAIIEDHTIEQVTDSIIHDELRQFQSRLYHEQPKLYNLIDQQGKLTDINDHRGHVRVSLNFISAPIDEVPVSEFSFDKYEQLLNDFSQLDLTDIEPYLNPDYRKSQGFNGGSNLHKRFEHITEVHRVISKRGISFESYLSEDAKKIIEAIEAARYPQEDGKIKNFNSKREKEHQVFFGLTTISKLMDVIDMSNGLESYTTDILANLNRHIVLAVRERLPIILEERSQTTFSLQMVRLNQALSGKQGDKLARYIRHHYPVALIDESQDINGEQAMMIQNIYLPKNTNNKQRSNHEFLLLVGDPKQAIYGFRGGDVSNYNFMKRQFDDKHIWTLDVNRRSNAGVINALNHWFSMPTRASNKQNRLAGLGDNIYYQHIKAANQDAKLSWLQSKIHSNPQSTDVNVNGDTDIYQNVLPNKAVSVINLPYNTEAKYDEYETTARHIAAILRSGQTLDGKPIQPSDIGVLARAKKDLKQVEDQLVKLNVPTLTTSDVSIFETIIAEDVAAVLSAMLQPYKQDMVNRVLTSHLYGLSVKQAKAMMLDHETGVAEAEGYKQSQQSDSKKSYQDFITYLKEGADRWQRFGILSALHYLFESSPVQPQGVWQTLAMYKDGDRHIMDLRHVMDVLAQYGMGMGEFELLAWFRQNIDDAPNSEWAKQYPLPTESGVQLMTIHKSKGLEFPIVYVLGMDAASRKSGNREDYGLYLYNVEQDSTQVNNSNNITNKTVTQRHFSVVQGTADDKEYYINLETKEAFDERKRLGYVAFTRASEQLYIVLKDPKDRREKERKPVVFWFDSDQKEYLLPERLKGIVGHLPSTQITEFYDSHYAKLETGVTQTKSTAVKKEPIKYDAFNKVMKETYFQGWAKTSFTALARQLDDSVQTLVVADERIDDTIDIADDISIRVANIGAQADIQDSIKAEDDIRFSFVKGANAGTFLHEIYEKIEFNNKAQWPQVIDQAVRRYQLPTVYASREQQLRILNEKISASNGQRWQATALELDIDDSQHHALIHWIEEVLHTPLLASNQALINIEPSRQFAELGFNMGVSEQFKAEAINQLFEQYVPEKDKHIHLLPQQQRHIYRYLRGEIDLVYEQAGRYHVVDYKSNFLGNSLSSYSHQTLKQAMSKAGYWLQAAIYQVALHRFLSLRIADYQGNEHRYLAPVEYMFLRGVHPAKLATAKSAYSSNSLGSGNSLDISKLSDSDRYGLVTWDIPLDFIKALDDLFGRPE